jgi:hypothetical protein
MKQTNGSKQNSAQGSKSIPKTSLQKNGALNKKSEKK